MTSINKGRLKVEYLALDRVRPSKQNARTHSDDQVAEIARSINEHGWMKPIIVDEKGEILAGHGAHRAAAALSMTEVPVIRRVGLTSAQKRAYRIADNKLAEKSAWDYQILATEFDALREAGFDMSLTGFAAPDVKSVLSILAVRSGNTDPNELPPAPKSTTTKTGDLWLLGEHRLLCGDSTRQADVARLMDVERAHLVMTSPPYANQRDYGTNQKPTQWLDLMTGVWDQLTAHALPTSHILINLGLVHRDRRVWTYWDGWLAHAERQGYPVFGWYVWDKGRALPGEWNGRLAPAHEFVFHFEGTPRSGKKWDGRLADAHDFTLHFQKESDGGRANKHVPAKTAGKRVSAKSPGLRDPNGQKHINGGKAFRQKDGSMKEATSPDKIGQPFKIPDSVIRVIPAYGQSEHPARFSVEFALFMLQTWSAPGDVVYEPFGGEGTSIIAAEQTNRRCRAMEIEPRYTDLAVIRWQNFTGRKAIHAEEKKSFDTLAKARKA